MRSRSMKIALGGVAVFGLLMAAACGGGSSSPAAPTAPAGGGGNSSADSTVAIAGFSYNPNPVSVKVGQSVAWHNSDGVSHTATSDSGAFDSGVVGPGSNSAPITMSSAGTFTYHCQIHPNMVATLNVQ